MNRREALAAGALAALGVAAAGCEPSANGDRLTSPSDAPTSALPAPSATPPPAPTLGALPPEVASGPADRPYVALTFHGQGDPDQAIRLLAELESAGARATVLAVGSWLDDQPAMAQRILDGGHELGNHTQHHLAIADMSAGDAYAEIDACARTLRRLTGSIGMWFRPSQTQHSTALIQAQAARVGYRTCLSYDVDSLDYTDPGANAVVRTTLDAVHNGAIISLHFGHEGTVTAMPALLDGLRRAALTPVTMTELLTHPVPR